MRWITPLILYSLIHLQNAWSADIDLHIGTHSIRATIANTPQTRARGLMQQNQLCVNCGMLFVFPKAGKQSFWMKGTPLSLAIAFIAADGSILNIAEMQAYTSNTHSSRGDIIYALEMNKSWFADHAIKAGDRVDGLQQAPPGQ